MNDMQKAASIALALLILPLIISLASAQALTISPPEEPAGPLTLEDCMLIALQRSPQLVSSAQDVVGADAALTRARSPYYPQLSLDAAEGIGSGGPGAADDTERTEQVDLVLRQTIWQSGLRERVNESGARLDAAHFSYAAAVQSLLERVAADYYGVLAAERLVGVAEAGVDSARRHLDEVQARIGVGLAAEVDAFTAEDDLARAELALIDANSNVKLARARLKTTIGVPTDTSLDLAEPAPLTAEAVPTLQQALAMAQEKRPELLGAGASVEAGRSALERARISRGPVADLSGRHEWGYTDWTRRDPSWDVSLSLSWPLLDGRATAADVLSARSALLRSEAQRQNVINEVGLEVESALVEAERARERVAASPRSVAAAQARLRAAEGRYQQGVAILLEVTDARAGLTEALAGQVRAEYDYRIALVNLQRALGTLSPPEIAGE